MKKFLFKLFYFFAIPMVLLSCIAAISIYCLSMMSSNCSLPKSITKIYIGDSHIKKTIDDAQLYNSKNLGESAESYYFSYYKIKTLLKANDQIKKINVGLSYHNLSYYYDNFIYGKGALSTTSKYFYILPVRQKLKLLQWNITHPRTCVKSLFNAGIHIIKDQPDFQFLGGYDNTFKEIEANGASIDKRIQHQFYHNQQLHQFSEFNIQYLKKIIALCKMKNIELIMIKTPLHKDYYKQISQKYLQKYNEIVKQNKLKLIDLSTLNLTNDCFAPDGDHLTQKGAILTTQELLKLKQ